MTAPLLAPRPGPPLTLALLAGRAALLLLAAVGALSLLGRAAPGGARAVASVVTQRAAAAACGGEPPRLGAWSRAPAGALPNPRAVCDGTTKAGARFRVFHATGRAFVVAPQELLDAPGARACLGAVGRAAVEALQSEFGGVGVDPRLVEPEPSWLEAAVKPGLQLPWAREFVGDGALGKLYLDVENVQGGLKGKTPTMKKVEYEGWARVARVFNNGGRHLDFGTGSSSHYACGVYAHVNAIDSQKKYCELVQSQMSAQQSRCGAIGMNCVDVGKLASFGHPTNSTDVSYYFARYVTAVDGFRNAPYYDTALIDGRFRVACAIKTLRYLRRDSLFFMHDWPRRYRPVEAYADLLATHGTFAVLAPKANLTADADLDFSEYRDRLR